MSTYTPGHGEHPKAREAMDDLVKRARESGASPKRAEELARDTARREDRKRNG